MSSEEDLIIKNTWSRGLLSVSEDSLKALGSLLKRNPSIAFEIKEDSKTGNCWGNFAPCILGFIQFAKFCNGQKSSKRPETVERSKMLWKQALAIMTPIFESEKFTTIAVCAPETILMYCNNVGKGIHVTRIPSAMTGAEFMQYYVNINREFHLVLELIELFTLSGTAIPAEPEPGYFSPLPQAIAVDPATESRASLSGGGAAAAAGAGAVAGAERFRTVETIGEIDTKPLVDLVVSNINEFLEKNYRKSIVFNDVEKEKLVELIEGIHEIPQSSLLRTFRLIFLKYLPEVDVSDEKVINTVKPPLLMANFALTYHQSQVSKKCAVVVATPLAAATMAADGSGVARGDVDYSA